jgi:circadian clock protein KaiC
VATTKDAILVSGSSPKTNTDRTNTESRSDSAFELPRCPTGMEGLDEITGGGLPLGRPTLICGAAGCGKTILAAEFLVRGATQYGDPGLFVAFEERSAELAQNVRSLGFDLDDLAKRNLITVDHIHVERSDIAETGAYDLEGLFIRIGYEIDRIGAKRVVLDTIESLFSGFGNAAILRAELRRLFRWLKDRGVTAIITAERGHGSLTRQGLEEYVSDCVILLDHRVEGQVSTRRMRIVKFRGASHGTNEYPFLIDESGVSVIPITSLNLRHGVSDERASSGIPALDEMLGGAGYYRGSSVLVSGTSGSGKTSVAAHFADSICRRGERCLYFAFEESEHQILRNMASIGLDLEQWTQKDLLRVRAARPTLTGFEMHLATMMKAIRSFRPDAVVIDPISNLASAGSSLDARAMLLRLVDFLKSEGITAFMTDLTTGRGSLESTDVEISSLTDTWLLLRDIELGGERNRALYVLKSRGMRHSNQIREFLLTDRGVRLVEVYARSRSEAQKKRRRELATKRKALEAKLAELQAELEAQSDELAHLEDQGRSEEAQLTQDRAGMVKSRGAWDADGGR